MCWVISLHVDSNSNDITRRKRPKLLVSDTRPTVRPLAGSNWIRLLSGPEIGYSITILPKFRISVEIQL